MNLAFYSGVSGLMAFQHDIDNLAHNMANVNTYGYKPSRMSFNDILYTEMDINNEIPELVGHGVKPVGVDLIFGQGPLQTTGYALDYAIEGEGFFSVERRGRIEYTRNGAFDISTEGKNGYLTTADGAYVLDAKGSRIKLDKAENSDLFNLENVGEKIGIYTFQNPYDLQVTDSSSFLPTTRSGPATAVSTAGTNKADLPYKLVNRALEGSGVDVAQSMVDVMMTQRAFQFNSRIVQTADQLDEIVNTLR